MTEETTGAEADDEYDLYPDLWPAVALFVDQLVTQWNKVDGAPVGLRYEVLPVIMDFEGIPAAERRDLFADLRTMEIEALRLWRRK